MDPRFDQALLQPQEEGEEKQQLELRNERHRLKFPNVKQLKSFEILNSAVKNFTSNTKFLSFVILSILPFFAFIVFYEIQISEATDAILRFLVPTSMSYDIGFDSDENISLFSTTDKNDSKRETFRIVFELVPLYLILLPLLELFSLTIVINISAKVVDAGNMKSTNLKETLYQKNNFKGPFITSLWVQLFSASNLFGLIWAVANHSMITARFDYSFWNYRYESVLPNNVYVNILSILFHTLISLALLYKYLDWSALWNMAIVISVLEGETGLDALEISAYYRKHCKRTGFQLMLIFFVYIVALRLPILLARMCSFVTVRVAVTAIVVVLVCLGSLVKWVTMVLYFYDCKAQAMLKKFDDEDVGQAVKDGDVCTV
ncbi:uncharacterized protein LOC110708446 [Chenopodium quinoa]|uniref:Uncharacterized protein n=1 Tax=Chenopodium quinoa TaxID=63459 RepID=A0A803L0H0_CHEQI|nr:uncharacterized protein LOC110708446 [Chenopodium quinoa]